MNKKILMIANNTGGIGALEDLKRYKNFFLSPEGGAWLPQEILPPLESPSFCELTAQLCVLNLENLDYLVVVFSGHGALDTNGVDTQLCLRGQELSFDGCVVDRYLFGHAKKQLTIIDCCRREEENEIITENVKCARTQLNTEVINKIRRSYEAQIERAPQGNCIVYACARSQEAMGEDSIGGEFSSLLNNSDFIGSNSDSKKCAGMTVNAAFNKVCATLHTKGVYPEIVNNPEDIGSLPWMVYPEHF